jgi:hypothetical protein
MTKNLLIFIWGASTLIVVILLHRLHMVHFRAPEKINFSRFKTDDLAKLNMWHFIAAGCGCSEHLIDHLTERGYQKEYQEKVFLIGDSPEFIAKLKAAGFPTENISIEEIQDEEFLSAVPLLLIFDQTKFVHYAGGYAADSLTPLASYQDLTIARSIASDEKTQSLPIKGCAQSKKIQSLIDPLGLKYRSSL